MEAKISTCIITYNEEDNIERCIRSVLPFSDEVVVVDSLSKDKTVEIAKKYTDRVFLQPFLGHVKQKNLAISKASHLWIFAIDADEFCSKELQEEIKVLKERNFMGMDGFFVKRVSYYLGRWMRRGLWSNDWKLRLFRKDKGRWGGKDPHDRVVLKGKTGKLKGELLHRVYRNLSHHIDVINRYTSTISEGKGRPSKLSLILNLTLYPLLFFIKGYILKMGFLEGIPGLIQAVNGSFYAFTKYAKLYERYFLEGKDGFMGDD